MRHRCSYLWASKWSEFSVISYGECPFLFQCVACPTSATLIRPFSLCIRPPALLFHLSISLFSNDQFDCCYAVLGTIAASIGRVSTHYFVCLNVPTALDLQQLTRSFLFPLAPQRSFLPTVFIYCFCLPLNVIFVLQRHHDSFPSCTPCCTHKALG